MPNEEAGAGQGDTNTGGQQQQGTGQQQQQHGSGNQGDQGKSGHSQSTGTDGKQGQQQQQQQQQQQSTDGKGGSQTGTAGAGDTTPKAPAKYELTLPEGGRVTDVHRAQIEKMARANDWSNDDAQAAVDELDAQMAAQSSAWLEAAKKDPDYGGEKLAESQRLAKLVIDRVRPQGHARRDAFTNLLNSTGYGNHPEVVAFFADLGKLMDEDGGAGHSGGQSKGASGNPADKMYDHPTSRKLAGQST